MSRVEAAKALGISPTQLDTEKREGRIAPRYLGRKPLYPIRELQAWLDALPSEPPTAY
ncbi:helix-turn-helix domain-containing protein [Mycobacteroides chelonae]|uniref:helix-turn-helix domain-containing protein n=1 Tax=Mycobacteroides chelonae TaxID=1774 RepID=UPI001F408D19|nr:helix-turn-helix domain-containing protein [Mycobacteroides chelonae]